MSPRGPSGQLEAFPPRGVQLASGSLPDRAADVLNYLSEGPPASPELTRGLVEVALGRGLHEQLPVEGADMAYELLAALGLLRLARRSSTQRPDGRPGIQDSNAVQDLAGTDFVCRFYVAVPRRGPRAGPSDLPRPCPIGDALVQDPGLARGWTERFETLRVLHLCSFRDPLRPALEPMRLEGWFPATVTCELDAPGAWEAARDRIARGADVVVASGAASTSLLDLLHEGAWLGPSVFVGLPDGADRGLPPSAPTVLVHDSHDRETLHRGAAFVGSTPVAEHVPATRAYGEHETGAALAIRWAIARAARLDHRKGGHHEHTGIRPPD